MTASLAAWCRPWKGAGLAPRAAPPGRAQGASCQQLLPCERSCRHLSAQRGSWRQLGTWRASSLHLTANCIHEHENTDRAPAAAASGRPPRPPRPRRRAAALPRPIGADAAVAGRRFVAPCLCSAHCRFQNAVCRGRAAPLLPALDRGHATRPARAAPSADSGSQLRFGGGRRRLRDGLLQAHGRRGGGRLQHRRTSHGSQAGQRRRHPWLRGGAHGHGARCCLFLLALCSWTRRCVCSCLTPSVAPAENDLRWRHDGCRPPASPRP